MPDRGLLERPVSPVPALGGGTLAPWAIPAARVAQITFEVDQASALGFMPPDVTRPVPCYGRLFVVDAADSPVGAFRMAALMVGGRYRMMPKNILVQAVVDGPVDAFSGAFGAGFVAGTISVDRQNQRLEVRIAAGSQDVAALTLPSLRAIDPTMLRWDAWLGFAENDAVTSIIEFGPRPEPVDAFLSKAATLETPAGLDRANPWRALRNLNTVSSCMVEGPLELTAPEVQQTLL